jgi:Zn-dependent peptidase ImmA (M78 family)/transcriptional regulator with XRE-family HTH domain
VNFNGDRLRIGRLFSDLTQSQLAAKVAVSQALIAEYERENKQPKGDILEALAVVLSVEPDFFFERDEDEFHEDECNFRRRLTAPERLKRKVLAQATLFGVVVRRLNRYVQFPAFDVPSITVQSFEDIERAAEKCRAHWGLGQDTPIANMSRVLENAGVVLTQPGVEIATQVDAFSRFGDISVVVLNTAKGNPSRAFFDTAHEAGHGVMHQTEKAGSLDKREDQADYFAGAFLLPRKAFAREFWHGREWSHLFDLKRRWGTSLQAILVRAYQLGLIDAAEYRTRFRYISKRGWRTMEPEEPEPETPELFRIALDQFTMDTGRSVADLSRELHWSPSLFRAVTGVDIGPIASDSVTSLSEYRGRRAVSG